MGIARNFIKLMTTVKSKSYSTSFHINTEHTKKNQMLKICIRQQQTMEQ